MSSSPPSSDLAGGLPADGRGPRGAAVTAVTLVELAVRLLPSVAHASLVVRKGTDDFRPLARTSTQSGRLDDLQASLGEGPGVAVSSKPGWVCSRDVARDTRWPVWGAGAADLGIGSVLAISLIRRDAAIGSLTLYAAEVGAFVAEEVDDALALAAHGSSVLSDAHDVDGLRDAMATRHHIGMAQGLLMERFGLDEKHAFAVLQRLSSTSNTKLREVADKLVEERRFDEARATVDEVGTTPTGPAPAGR